MGMAVLAILLAGCELRYTKAYSGPKLPSQKVAVVLGEVQLTPSSVVPVSHPEFYYSHEFCYSRTDPPFPCDSLLFVRYGSLEKREWIAVSRVDEYQLAKLPGRIQVLPGHRTIAVLLRRYWVPNVGEWRPIQELANESLEFDAKADHTYRIRFQRVAGNEVVPPYDMLGVHATKINVWIEDTQNGDVVSGMKPSS